MRKPISLRDVVRGVFDCNVLGIHAARRTDEAGINAWRRSRPATVWVVLAALSAPLLWASAAQAQVQRSFINLGFEEPVLPSNNCWSIREDAIVPGWETTEPTFNGTWDATTHGTCGGHKAAPPIEGGIQIFKGTIQDLGGFITNPASGSQYAELNAFTPSRLYQNVCLVSGDAVNWSLAHKGRGATNQMQFISEPIHRGPAASPL